MQNNETTQRNIYYYELHFKPYKSYEGVEHAYLKCFKHLNTLVKNRDKTRYLSKDNYTLFFGQLEFIGEKKYIKGKLFKVRNDIFPQIIDMNNEDIQDIVTDEKQGILETTHFLVDYRKKTQAQIAVEYNHYGARISELVSYLSHISRNIQVLKKITYIPIVRDRLKSMPTRVNRISNIDIKVHKDNISRIQKIDEGLGTALYNAQNYSVSDYVEMVLKIDFKKKSDTPQIRKRILNWVGIFTNNPEESENFDKFRIDAEDEEYENNLEQFDLLIDKEKSKLVVEKKKQSRVIISNDLFPKIIDEYERKFL